MSHETHVNTLYLVFTASCGMYLTCYLGEESRGSINPVVLQAVHL